MKAVQSPMLDSIMDTMVDSACQPMGAGRPEGLHLSHITKWLRIKRGKTVGGIEGEMDGIRMYAGFMWERALEIAFQALQVCRRDFLKQVRTEWDGIHVTTDGLDVTEITAPILHEDKLTWRSVGKVDKLVTAGVPLHEALEEHFWEWVAVQIPGYLYVLSQVLGVPVRKCQLNVFFVNGDYSHQRGRGPQIRVWELEYTEEELAETWAMILSAKRGMEAEQNSVAQG